MALDEILALPTGARFYRADLHVHSYGASHDVKDAAMTPQAIVKTAIQEKLDVIAITDHNEIGNVEAAQGAAKGTNLLVIPGVELSTPEGHLLCYLPTFADLIKFYSRLTIADRGLPNSRCQQSCLECLNALGTMGGIGVFAHVDAGGGYEHENPGGSPHKLDVLSHKALKAIELKFANSDISYSSSDPNADRARIGQERVRRLNLGTRQSIARVLNSDAHTLTALGRNAEAARKITRYKMDTPSFEALRIALEDSDARVRIEDLIPATIPSIVGVTFDGGFLKGQKIHFSSNLNCIIGGRGTGKSTAFEAISCLTERPSESKVIDSDVWPDELFLFWMDQAGQHHSLSRPKEENLVNLDDPGTGPTSFDIDCFAQGEAARISIEAQSDPLALLRYLDKFVDLKDALIAEQQARDSLLDLQAEIEKSEQKVILIPQHEQLLATTQRQLQALQKPEVKELIGLQRNLAHERTLRTQIGTNIQSAKKSLSLSSQVTAITDIANLANPKELAVGSIEFAAILKGVADFGTSMATLDSQITTGLSSLEKAVAAQMTAWKTKEAGIQKKVDDKKRELEALNVQFDMAYIAKLTRDEANYSATLRELKKWIPRLEDLKKTRATALKERWNTRGKVASLRDAFGRMATAKLREALTDLDVSLKYDRDAHSPDAADQIISAMGWRTNQQQRANWLVEHLTLPKLLDAVEKKDTTPLVTLKTSEGADIFRDEEARNILERLSEPSIKYALQRVAVHDLPRLRVTKMVSDSKGERKPIIRDFAKLSLGQQQSVLLALILSSDSNRPLIIDQPEDNLDGEFIYSTLVPVLRQAKERRQVIIVTHNANVAVLGDAEQIIVMKAVSDHGEIVAQGSIDNPVTRDAACAILEGAKEAFLRRSKVYGIQ